MSLFNYLKDVVSETAVENLSTLTNENSKSLRTGFDLALGSFLISVLKFVENKSGLELLDILNAGGHSGEILNNFEGFTSSVEKTSLLESIGNNIARHFMGDSVNEVAVQISADAGISNKTAFTLLSFSAPLMLGALGKAVKDNKLGDEDVVGLLRNEVRFVQNVLTPKVEKVIGVSDVHKTNVLNGQKGIEWIHILPWIFLALLGLVVFYFSKKDTEIAQKAEIIHDNSLYIVSDSSSLDSLTLNNSREIVKEQKGEDAKLKVETPSTLKSTSEVNSNKLNSSKNISTNRFESKTERQPTAAVEDKTPAGLNSISSASFKFESAEISSNQNLKTILNELKESSKTLHIYPLTSAGRLGEDRAYAMRDWLLENGVSLDKIKIQKAKSGSNSVGLGYELK